MLNYQRATVHISCAVQASPWGGQRVPDDPPGTDTVWKVAAPSPGHAAPSASRVRAASGVGHGSRASGAASLPWAPCPPFRCMGTWETSRESQQKAVPWRGKMKWAKRPISFETTKSCQLTTVRTSGHKKPFAKHPRPNPPKKTSSKSKQSINLYPITCFFTQVLLISLPAKPHRGAILRLPCSTQEKQHAVSPLRVQPSIQVQGPGTVQPRQAVPWLPAHHVGTEGRQGLGGEDLATDGQICQEPFGDQYL